MTHQMTRRSLLVSVPMLAAVRRLLAQEARPTLTLRTLNHIAITVSDKKRSMEFYQGLFGWPINHTQGGTQGLNAGFSVGPTGIRVGPGPQYITMSQGARPGWGHFCMTVEGFDVDRITQVLTRHGVSRTRTSEAGPMKAWVRSRGPENGGANEGTPEFYINIVRELLKSGIRFDSVCLKDASGTTNPRTCYETAKGIKAILPPEIPLIQHTHDTASTAVACYMAGIDGGVDGIDLAVRPLASGTSQPDVRSMAHALKGTGYSLDIDHTKMDEIESLLNEGLSEYEFNPVTTSADARVVGFPMPGGAIGPNVHMMQSAGILDKYSAVLAEFPEVVRAGGGWTSVTPGSQQYWLQAFNNVLHGRWEKIDAGFGKSVLGYFGKPPLSPDPEVVKIAAEQLKLPPFDGDPLEAAPDTLAEAEAALKERGIEVTDENKFLVAAAIVPGKNMELNEGIRLLEGRSKITLPLKKEPTVGAATLTAPTKTKVTVNEGGNTRTYEVIIEPPASATAPALAQAQTGGGQATDVFSPFDGNVELVEVNVKVGDTVTQGQVVAAVEAMKAKHDVKAPCAGRVSAVHAAIGNEVSAGKPILSIEA